MESEHVPHPPNTGADAEPVKTLLMGMFWIYIVFV